jgi:hypothetical protein
MLLQAIACNRTCEGNLCAVATSLLLLAITFINTMRTKRNYFTIGLAIGVALGIAMRKLAIGIAIGVVIGLILNGLQNRDKLKRP